jgi:hypothetical protein
MVTGEWRRLRNEELYDLYSSPDIRVIKSRKIRWARYVACMGDRKEAYRVLGGMPEGKTQLVRPRRRWEVMLKWVIRKWDGGMDWIDLAQDRECGK